MRERVMTDTLLSVRVAEKHEAAQDIVSLDLVDPAGGIIAAGELANEDTFIEAARAEIARVRGES